VYHSRAGMLCTLSWQLESSVGDIRARSGRCLFPKAQGLKEILKEIQVLLNQFFLSGSLEAPWFLAFSRPFNPSCVSFYHLQP
jgi:hypothetical protein